MEPPDQSQTQAVAPTEEKRIPPYLSNNSWAEELNYKLWTTKGSRFRADKRCNQLARWSQLSVALLTSYLIILSVVPVWPGIMGPISASHLSFIATALSIVLLVYSLIESDRNYALKAYQFHQCGLKVAELYDRLRMTKEEKDETVKRATITAITREYEVVLGSHENHEPIDYALFQTDYPTYFKLTPENCCSIRRSYYIKTVFVYHLLIIAPLIVFALFYFLSSQVDNQFPPSK